MLLTLAALSPPALALDGYVFAAPGGVTSGRFNDTTLHVGGGAEIGGIGLWRNLSGGFGLASIYGSYHFRQGARVDPFVTGGYSVAFRGGHLNLGTFGGGANFWLRDRFGLAFR